MPELPEVETTRKGIERQIKGEIFDACTVHQPSMRWPVPSDFADGVTGRKLLRIERRAKYLIFRMEGGNDFLLHLGMSGSLRLTDSGMPRRKHDHVEWETGNGILRFYDPRRFGCVRWLKDCEALLVKLGPEPLSDAFSSEYLLNQCLKRRKPIKQVLMDNPVVVGVGNIYAQEALFLAGISPERAACSLEEAEAEELTAAIKDVLCRAIETGGTTLKDFVNPEGQPGYFAQSLKVYGRAGEPCLVCGSTLKGIRQGGRATAYCSQCQK